MPITEFNDNPDWIRNGEPIAGSSFLPAQTDGAANRSSSQVFKNTQYLNVRTTTAIGEIHDPTPISNDFSATKEKAFMHTVTGDCTITFPSNPAHKDYFRFRMVAGVDHFLVTLDGNGETINHKSTVTLTSSFYNIVAYFDDDGNWSLQNANSADGITVLNQNGVSGDTLQEALEGLAGGGGTTEVADGDTILGDGTAGDKFKVGEGFLRIPPWAAGSYLKDQVVRKPDGTYYRAIQDTSQNPPSGHWEVVTAEDAFKTYIVGGGGGSTELSDGDTILGDGTSGNRFKVGKGFIRVSEWTAGSYLEGQVRLGSDGKYYKANKDTSLGVPSADWDEVGEDDLFCCNGGGGGTTPEPTCSPSDRTLTDLGSVGVTGSQEDLVYDGNMIYGVNASLYSVEFYVWGLDGTYTSVYSEANHANSSAFYSHVGIVGGTVYAVLVHKNYTDQIVYTRIFTLSPTASTLIHSLDFPGTDGFNPNYVMTMDAKEGGLGIIYVGSPSNKCRVIVDDGSHTFSSTYNINSAVPYQYQMEISHTFLGQYGDPIILAKTDVSSTSKLYKWNSATHTFTDLPLVYLYNQVTNHDVYNYHSVMDSNGKIWIMVHHHSGNASGTSTWSLATGDPTDSYLPLAYSALSTSGAFVGVVEIDGDMYVTKGDLLTVYEGLDSNNDTDLVTNTTYSYMLTPVKVGGCLYMGGTGYSLKKFCC